MIACPLCTCDNPKDYTMCMACDAPNPKNFGISFNGPSVDTDDSHWSCKSCTYVAKTDVFKCPLCNTVDADQKRKIQAASKVAKQNEKKKKQEEQAAKAKKIRDDLVSYVNNYRDVVMTLRTSDKIADEKSRAAIESVIRVLYTASESDTSHSSSSSAVGGGVKAKSKKATGCQVCMTPFDKQSRPRTTVLCFHSTACTDCFQEYIRIKVRDKEVLPYIKCPDPECKMSLHYQDIIKSGISTHDMFLLAKTHMQKHLARKPEWVECKTDKCDFGFLLFDETPAPSPTKSAAAANDDDDDDDEEEEKSDNDMVDIDDDYGDGGDEEDDYEYEAPPPARKGSKSGGVAPKKSISSSKAKPKPASRAKLPARASHAKPAASASQAAASSGGGVGGLLSAIISPFVSSSSSSSSAAAAAPAPAPATPSRMDRCVVCGTQQKVERKKEELDDEFKKWIREGKMRACPKCNTYTIKEYGICNVIECGKCGIWWNWRSRETGKNSSDLKNKARSMGTLWEPGELHYQQNLQRSDPKAFKELLERNGLKYDPNYVRGT